VWLARRGAAGPDQQAAWLTLLDANERVRWQGLELAAVRDRYLAGRALVRMALSRHTGVRPDAWRFGTGPRGKPFIAAPQAWHGLRFNLSHADDLLACAVGRVGRLGIDVEHARVLPDWPVLARRICSPAEQDYLARAAARRRAEQFCAVWTLKEAYGKAWGTGLALPLADVSFDFGPAGATLRPSGRLAGNPAHWRFLQFRSRNGYRMALALTMPPERRLHVTLRAADALAGPASAATVPAAVHWPVAGGRVHADASAALSWECA